MEILLFNPCAALLSALFPSFLSNPFPVCFSGDFEGLVLGVFWWCFFGFCLLVFGVVFSLFFDLVTFGGFVFSPLFFAAVAAFILFLIDWFFFSAGRFWSVFFWILKAVFFGLQGQEREKQTEKKPRLAGRVLVNFSL